MNINRLAANLRAAREKKGFTLQYVADLIGVTPANICHYEKGKKTPPIKRLSAMAVIYGESVDSLLK